MSNYFKDFPKTPYRFGDEIESVEFQHLGTYIDILDQVKDYSVFYQNYSIQNGERPDQLSYKLYRSSNYHWTFYLLNDHLRQGGWPIRDADVYPKAKQYYPNTVLAVDGVAMRQEPTVAQDGSVVWSPSQEHYPMVKSTTFVPGNYLYFPNSKVAGEIIKIDQQMAMIWTDAVGIRTVDTECISISPKEGLAVIADADYLPQEQYSSMHVQKKWDEFDAPHRYEDVSGNWIFPSYSSKYPNPFDHNSVNTMNSVSYYQKLSEYNETQKSISVIKPENIVDIATEFRNLLRNA